MVSPWTQSAATLLIKATVAKDPGYVQPSGQAFYMIFFKALKHTCNQPERLVRDSLRSPGHYMADMGSKHVFLLLCHVASLCRALGPAQRLLTPTPQTDSGVSMLCQSGLPRVHHAIRGFYCESEEPSQLYCLSLVTPAPELDPVHLAHKSCVLGEFSDHTAMFPIKEYDHYRHPGLSLL